MTTRLTIDVDVPPNQQHDQRHTDEPHVGTETSPIDALLTLDEALRRLGESDDPGACEMVPVSTLRAAGLLLLDYRRRLPDTVGEQIKALPSLPQRDRALDAYQHVSQCTAVTLAIFDEAVGACDEA